MERATEIEYLKFFYGTADFGPADEDVRDIIRKQFILTHKKHIPKGYSISGMCDCDYVECECKE